MTRTRFLTGSLATLAVASAFTLAAPAAQAADEVPCGQPGTAAIYQTVTVPAVFETVPAVTHTEWRWTRDVAAYEFEFTQQISPAATENDWTREVPGPLEYLFTRTVVDSPAVPAVPAVPEVGHLETVVVVPAVVVTEVEYQHEQTGKLRWEDADWGAQNGQGNGWSKTGNTRQVEVTPAVTTQTWVVDVPGTPEIPAVPEVSHVESAWAFTSPGASWTGPVDERATAPTTETATTDGPAPAGAGWTLVDTRVTPAVFDTLWALVAPEGYSPTGESRVAGSTREETEGHSAEAPEGKGWEMIADSETVVVDVPEQLVVVTPESTEEVLVSPAVPASEPCVDAPATEENPTAETPDQTEGVAAPTTQAAAGPVGTVLPNTGNDLPPWMAPAGFAAMLAGIGIIRAARRAAD